MNGTKFVIRAVVSPRLLECERIGFDGRLTGHVFLLPRISMTYALPRTGIQLLRRQFPLALAYALTFNKAQGQTLSRVGIDFRHAPFAHGQVFVAFSRARSARDCCVLLPNVHSRTIPNVVMLDLLSR